VVEITPAPRRLGGENADLRGDVETIVAKSLEKEPERRYQSAGDLGADLRRFLADEPIAARPPSATYQLRTFARRNRTLVGAGAVVSLTLVAGIVTTSALFVQAEQARALAEAGRLEADRNLALAEQRRERAEREAAKSEAMLAFLTEEIVPAGDPSTGAAYDVRMSEVLAGAARGMESRFAAQPEVDAALRRTLAEAFRGVGDPERAHAQATRSLAALRMSDEADERAMLSARLLVAETLTLLGEHDRAIEMLEAIRDESTRAFGPGDRLSLRAGARLLDAHTLATHTDEALRIGDSLLSRMSEEADGDLAELRGGVMMQIAETRRLMADEEGAIEMSRRAVEALRPTLGPDARLTQQAESRLGLALNQAGRPGEARTIFEDLIDRLERRYGPDSPRLMTPLNNLALAHRTAGEPGLALPIFERVVMIGDEAIGADHPDQLITRHNIGLCLSDLGRFDEAVEAFEACLRTKVDVLGDAHRSTNATRSDLAYVHFRQGRFAEAERLMIAAADAMRAAHGSTDTRLLETLANLAMVHRRMGRLDEAVASLDEALSGYRATLPDGHYRIGHALGARGQTLARLGEEDAARRDLAEAVRICSEALGEDHALTRRFRQALAAMQDDGEGAGRVSTTSG